MRLIVETGEDIGQEFRLTRAVTSLGCSPDTDIVLDDAQVSRHHAQIRQEGDGFVVVDLGSANGTFVNAVRLLAPQALQHGDRLRLGETTLSFQMTPEVQRPVVSRPAAVGHRTSPEPIVAVGAVVLLVAAIMFFAPTPEPPGADLTAKQDEVRWRRAPAEATRALVNTAVPIQVGDQVTVDKTGRGLLRFRDRLLVEIFRGTETILREARWEAGGSIFVKLRQAFGHNRYRLEALAGERVAVEVETDYATIRAVGTEFLVCHGKALTCLVTLDGEAEVEAQGETVVIGPGEATYVKAGEPPKPPLCADVEQVNRWLQEMRDVAEAPALGTIVAEWPEEPCSPVPPISRVTPAPSYEDLATSSRLFSIDNSSSVSGIRRALPRFDIWLGGQLPLPHCLDVGEDVQ